MKPGTYPVPLLFHRYYSTYGISILSVYGTKICLNISLEIPILRVPHYPLKPKKGFLGNIVLCIIAPSCSIQTTEPILAKFAHNVYV